MTFFGTLVSALFISTVFKVA